MADDEMQGIDPGIAVIAVPLRLVGRDAFEQRDDADADDHDQREQRPLDDALAGHGDEHDAEAAGDQGIGKSADEWAHGVLHFSDESMSC